MGFAWQPQCEMMWTSHGCWAFWLRLVCPFRSLAHAHPLVPFALLSLTLAPSSGLSLSYFLRPPHLTTPPDPTPPHPHQRFLTGRFVCRLQFYFWVFSLKTLLLLCCLCFSAFMLIDECKGWRHSHHFAVAHRTQFDNLSSQRCAKLKWPFHLMTLTKPKVIYPYLHQHLTNSWAKSTASMFNWLHDCWMANAGDAQLEVSVFPSAAAGLGQIEFLRAIVGQHSAT